MKPNNISKKSAKKRTSKTSSMQKLISQISKSDKAPKSSISKESPPQIDTKDFVQPSSLIGLDISNLPILPDLAMPDWIGKVVSAVCNKSEVHPVAALINLLSQFAAQLSEPFIEYGGSKQHCRTNFVLGANSPKAWKAMNDTSIGRIFDGILNKSQRVQGHMSTGENLIELVMEENRSAGSGHRLDEYTSLGLSGNRLHFLENEFSSALSTAKRSGNTLSPTISGFFNYGSADQSTKSGMLSAKDAHVVILANTSCTDFSALRNDVQHSNDFASYFLWFLVDRIKLEAEPKYMTDEEVDGFQDIISRRIQAAKGLTTVEMSNKAKALWITIYPDLTKGVPGIAGSVVSRSEIHTIRLALIYALAAGRYRIESKDLKAAHALVMYAQESAIKIFNGDQQSDIFKGKILCALHSAPDHEMSQTEISGIFSRNADAADIKGALRELEELKKIEIEKKKSKLGREKTIVKLVSK